MHILDLSNAKNPDVVRFGSFLRGLSSFKVMQYISYYDVDNVPLHLSYYYPSITTTTL